MTNNFDNPRPSETPPPSEGLVSPFILERLAEAADLTHSIGAEGVNLQTNVEDKSVDDWFRGSKITGGSVLATDNIVGRVSLTGFSLLDTNDPRSLMDHSAIDLRLAYNMKGQKPFYLHMYYINPESFVINPMQGSEASYPELARKIMGDEDVRDEFEHAEAVKVDRGVVGMSFEHGKKEWLNETSGSRVSNKLKEAVGNVFAPIALEAERQMIVNSAGQNQ